MRKLTLLPFIMGLMLLASCGPEGEKTTPKKYDPYKKMTVIPEGFPLTLSELVFSAHESNKQVTIEKSELGLLSQVKSIPTNSRHCFFDNTHITSTIDLISHDGYAFITQKAEFVNGSLLKKDYEKVSDEECINPASVAEKKFKFSTQDYFDQYHKKLQREEEACSSPCETTYRKITDGFVLRKQTHNNAEKTAKYTIISLTQPWFFQDIHYDSYEDNLLMDFPGKIKIKTGKEFLTDFSFLFKVVSYPFETKIQEKSLQFERYESLRLKPITKIDQENFTSILATRNFENSEGTLSIDFKKVKDKNQIDVDITYKQDFPDDFSSCLFFYEITLDKVSDITSDKTQIFYQAYAKTSGSRSELRNEMYFTSFSETCNNHLASMGHKKEFRDNFMDVQITLDGENLSLKFNNIEINDLKEVTP